MYFLKIIRQWVFIKANLRSGIYKLAKKRHFVGVFNGLPDMFFQQLDNSLLCKILLFLNFCIASKPLTYLITENRWVFLKYKPLVICKLLFDNPKDVLADRYMSVVINVKQSLASYLLTLGPQLSVKRFIGGAWILFGIFDIQRSLMHYSLPYEYSRRTPRSGGRGGKFAQKQRSPKAPILRIVGVIALCVVLGFGVLALVDHLSESGTEKNIATVQNGYLGEYTDLTVKEILDSNYGVMYETSLWDGGTTDAGETIVQVKYFYEGNDIEPTIIRFSMMNQECFKITTFIDPSNPIEKSSDLFAAMNYNYMLAHIDHNPTMTENKADEYEFVQRLDQISGSAVKYGAAASYNGDRSKLCELDNETPLGLSAAMLLDNYGLFDMAYYWGNDAFGQTASKSENSSEDLFDNAQESEATEASRPATTPPQTEPPAYEGSLELLVTVTESSGGLNIRSGPGSNYEKVGRLAVGETVTVTKVQSNGSSQWGKIDRGWICMDYVEVAGQRPADTSSVSMTVCVKPSAGELKIRNGPGSSYNEVGRLRGGEYATVTELQQNGNSQWGRIPTGWICMDYVDTVYGAQESYSGGWQYEGNWIEDKEANRRCTMEIERVEDDLFLVEMQGSISASEQICWSTPAFYDADWDCLFYSDCECWISVSMGNGNFYKDIQYEDGMGSLYMTNGTLCWEDYSGDNGASYFVPDNRPIFD